MTQLEMKTIFGPRVPVPERWCILKAVHGIAEVTDLAAIEEIQDAKCLESCIQNVKTDVLLVTMCCMASCEHNDVLYG